MSETYKGGFEWDVLKSARNFERRKLDFLTASSIWLGLVLQRRSDRDGEERYISYGVIDCRVVAVVWTPRNGGRRIISARRADRNERKIYEDYSMLLGRNREGQY